MKAAQLIQAALLGFWFIGQTGMGVSAGTTLHVKPTDSLSTLRERLASDDQISDPKFIWPEWRDYRLAKDSPCLELADETGPCGAFPMAEIEDSSLGSPREWHVSETGHDGGEGSAKQPVRTIQFYVDRQADLLIDNIFLYDEAPPQETRPFPDRVHFTGWFDTGKQGKEWPGDFQIVAHKPPWSWFAAKSVPHPSSDGGWLRIHLRGPRLMGERTALPFSVSPRRKHWRKRRVVIPSRRDCEWPRCRPCPA